MTVAVLETLTRALPQPATASSRTSSALATGTSTTSCSRPMVTSSMVRLSRVHVMSYRRSCSRRSALTVDFGYILGRDPKPFPPAVKVCKEMVDAMGGMHSPHYARFKNLCYTGFTTLRKNANLLINLVALMVDGNIPDIKLEPDKAVMKVRFRFLRSSRMRPPAPFLDIQLVSGAHTDNFQPCAGPGQVPPQPLGRRGDQGV